MQGILKTGSTPWIQLKGDKTMIAVDGTLGGGTITVEKRVNGKVYGFPDSTLPLTFSAAGSAASNSPAAEVRLTIAGETGAEVDWTLGNEWAVESSNQ